MELVHDWGFGVVWGVFALVWISKSRGTNETTSGEPFASRLVHLGLLAAGFVLIFAKGLPGVRLVPGSDALFFTGLAVAAAGVAFMIWARYHLGLYWSGAITLKEGHKLIRTGPYRFVRHPIYTGFVLAVAGSALSTGDLRGLVAIALVAGAYIRKIRLEERWLAQQFGEEYRQFQAEVNALVPFVW